jgi:hypothetical protein
MTAVKKEGDDAFSLPEIEPCPTHDPVLGCGSQMYDAKYLVNQFGNISASNLNPPPASKEDYPCILQI